MFKKITALCLILLFSMSALAGCGEDDDTKSVGFLTPYASTGFMAMLANEMETGFTEAGYEWNIGVADGSSTTQIEQIENMIVQEVDVLVVMAVDPTALSDVLQDAEDAGIGIINFTTNPGVGDIFVGADEFAVGESVAEIASDWIDSAFPDAADDSVNVTIMEFNGTPEAVERSEGLHEIFNLNSKATLTSAIEVENTTAAAQAATENLLLTNPEVNVILTYNTGMALGVNAYVMSEDSPVENLADFGVFGADNDQEVLTAIQDSVDNDSILRGATQLGDGNIAHTVDTLVGYADSLIAGEDVPENDYAEVNQITPDNVSDFIRE